jgi:hypothetical protein
MRPRDHLHRSEPYLVRVIHGYLINRHQMLLIGAACEGILQKESAVPILEDGATRDTQ